MAEITLLSRFSWIANVIFHQAIAVIFVYILTVIFGNYSADSLDTWHVVLSVIGVLLILTEAVAIFVPENVFTIYVHRDTRAKVHGMLSLCGTLILSIGIALKIASKENNSFTHFNTSHSVIGLITWILVVFSDVLGILSSNAAKLSSLGRPVVFRYTHTLVGICTFILGISTIGIGIYKDLFRLMSSEKTVDAAVIFLALLGAFALIRPCISCYHQLRAVLST